VEEGVSAERTLLLERLPYLAENTWNKEKQLPFEMLSEKIAQTDNKLISLIEKAENRV
jgi:hypothetical protein